MIIGPPSRAVAFARCRGRAYNQVALPPRRRRAHAPSIASASAPSGAAPWAERHHRVLVAGLLAGAATSRPLAFPPVPAVPDATAGGLFYQGNARTIEPRGLATAPPALR